MLDGRLLVDSSWNVMAHGHAQEGKWRGNWRMDWVVSTLHTTSEHGVSSVTTADAHTSAASSRLNWRPRWMKLIRPFRQKTKSSFCARAITFQLASTQTHIHMCVCIYIYIYLFIYLYQHIGMNRSYLTIIDFFYLRMWRNAYICSHASNIMCQTTARFIQRGTCYLRPFWSLKFDYCFQIFGKFLKPYIWLL